MNSQFLPGSTETQNRLSHEKLLREARKVRRLRKSARRETAGNPFTFSGTGNRRPNILEPALAALLTVVLAFQVAALVAI